MDITITLTDEQRAALEEAGKTGRGRMMLRRLGIRGKDVGITPEEFLNNIIKGVAAEQTRRTERKLVGKLTEK